MTGTTLYSTWEYYRDWGSVEKLHRRTAQYQATKAECMQTEQAKAEQTNDDSITGSGSSSSPK
jgi:hypothetical protein